MGDVNSVYWDQDRVHNTTTRPGWRTFCDTMSLMEITEQVQVPCDTFSCYVGAGSMIDTAATTEDSKIKIIGRQGDRSSWSILGMLGDGQWFLETQERRNSV